MTQDTNLNANADELQTLHQKVNAMLDIPIPKEGDDFPLPVEASVAFESPALDAAGTGAN